MYKKDGSFLDLSKNDVSFSDMSFLDELVYAKVEFSYKKTAKCSHFVW